MVNLIPLTLSLKGGNLRGPKRSFISSGDAVNYLDDCCVVGGGSGQELVSCVIWKKNNNKPFVWSVSHYAVPDDIAWRRTARITAVPIIRG